MQSKTPEQCKIQIQMTGCSWLENHVKTLSLALCLPEGCFNPVIGHNEQTCMCQTLLFTSGYCRSQQVDITGIVWAVSSALCLCVTWDALPLYFKNQQNCMWCLKYEIFSGYMRKRCGSLTCQRRLWVNDFLGISEYTNTWNWTARGNSWLKRFEVHECNHVHTQNDVWIVWNLSSSSLIRHTLLHYWPHYLSPPWITQHVEEQVEEFKAHKITKTIQSYWLFLKAYGFF